MKRNLRSFDWLLIPAALCVVWWLQPLDWPWWVWFVVALVMAGAGAALRPHLALDPLKELRRQILELRVSRYLSRSEFSNFWESEMLNYRPLWQSDREVDALNHALTIGHPQMDLIGLYSRVVNLFRLAYSMEREPNLSRNWHQPLAKIRLPILLGIETSSKFWVLPECIMETGKDWYSFASPVSIYSVNQFERFRATIEEIWQGPVIIEEMPGRPGGVRVRPAPVIPDVVPLTEIVKNTVVLGTDVLTGEVTRVRVRDLTHTLVVGTAGFGKSVFQHQVITQLMAADHDEVAEVVLVDLKGGVEFNVYTSSDNRVRAVWKYHEVLDTVQYLIDLMERRQVWMVQNGWRLFPGERVFFIVDEFAQIQLYPVEGKEGKAAHERLIANLNRLSMLGRAMGIVIIAAIQKATTDVMDSSFRMNLQGQVCFRVPNRLMAATMFGSVEDLRVDPVTLPRGRFIYYDPTTGTTRYLQAHVAAA